MEREREGEVGGTGGLTMSSCVIRRQRLALRTNWTELCWFLCNICNFVQCGADDGGDDGVGVGVGGVVEGVGSV